MAYQQFPGMSAYTMYAQEDQAYHGGQLSGTEDAMFNPYVANIDPSLECLSPTAHYSGVWNPQPMQRFLKDSHKLSFFNAMPPLQTMAPMALAPPVAPVPPASQGRPGSPVSSHEPTSTCSSARSPPGESEINSDNTPSTPPSELMLSPFQGANYDRMEPAQFYQFTGMGTFPTCVHLADVNPTQEPHFDCFDADSTVEFSLHRNFSFESQSSSHYETDAMSTQTPLDFGIKRLSSPEEMRPIIKDEIHIPSVQLPSTRSQYPPLGPEDDDNSDEEPEPAAPKQEEDDDEYTPGKKQRRAPSGVTRRSMTQKRPAPTRSQEKTTSKKQRTSVGPTKQDKGTKMLPPSSSTSKSGRKCPECAMHFKDDTGFDNHVKKTHTRPFVCVFDFAGCGATFASKNEWKRHVMSQHLVLHYWLCDQEGCAHNINSGIVAPVASVNGKVGLRVRGPAANGRAVTAPVLPNGAIFNRKDLFTQHLRRMHTPPHIKKATKQGKRTSHSATTTPEWDEHVRVLQQSAQRERCRLPTHMACPASGCSTDFEGVDAWDQRMEHVARHLDKAATGKEERVVFGGDGDVTLMAWATRPDVAVIRPAAGGGWEMNAPLKPDVSIHSTNSRDTITAVRADAGSCEPGVVVKNEIVVESPGEEDADGEDDD